MGTLHLNGTLDLSGKLILGDKVKIKDREALVVVTVGEEPHSNIAPPPKSPIKPDDPSIVKVWVTKSPNTDVKIKERALVVDGGTCNQGTSELPRNLTAQNCEVTVDGLAVVIEAKIGDDLLPLTSSGQS